MSLGSDDRLSMLPEDITSHILSLMPTKFAVRTSILSKRWRYSWTLVTNLDFEYNGPGSFHKKYVNYLDSIPFMSPDIRDNYPNGISDSFLKFVGKALEFCKSTQVKLFRLHVVRSFVPKSGMLNWIDKAVRLNISEIDIRAPMFELSLSLLTCKTLTKLRLDHVLGFTLEEGTYLVNLPCLKTLDIIIFSGPYVNALKLINGCPNLESLSFDVKLRKDEEDYHFNVPTLKRLKLTLPVCRSINKVFLNVPKLEYLYVGGRMCSVFVIEDASSLVEAYVSFFHTQMDHKWVELLKGIRGVRSLSAFSDPLPYIWDQIIPPLPIFPNLERLELDGFCHSRLVPQFLKSSPELKHLHIAKFGTSPWIKPKLVPACMLTNLTTIKFSRCIGEKSDIEFLRYMLGNAKGLKTVTITWKNSSIQGFWAAHVLNFPRASLQCEVYFL